MNQRSEFFPSRELIRLHRDLAVRKVAAEPAEDLEVDVEVAPTIKRGRKIFEDGAWLDGSADPQRARNVKFGVTGEPAR